MQKRKTDSRLSALWTTVALTLALSAPLAASADQIPHFWSAQPTGTAWVTSYGECWQSIHGPTNLEPCTVAPPAVPKEFTVRLNFEFDKYRIDNVVNDSELQRLDGYIAQVRQTPVREQITVVGHTDAKGSYEYNDALGMRRATTVRDYMVNKGIPASDIVSVQSRGKRELLPEYDIYSVQQRRVVIHADYEG